MLAWAHSSLPNSKALCYSAKLPSDSVRIQQRAPEKMLSDKGTAVRGIRSPVPSPALPHMLSSKSGRTRMSPRDCALQPVHRHCHTDKKKNIREAND